MKDNNKKMLLEVIAIATLIIAVMGATFAFFSASGGSGNNAVTANATTLANLGFTSSHSKIATNLVPVSSESPYFSRYPGIAASGAHSCLDDLGNQICSIYEFTVTNTASVAQTIYVSFVPSENTFDNMYFAAFNTSIASADYTVATGSSGSGANFVLTPQTTASNSTLGYTATKLTKNSTTAIDMPGLSTSLGAGDSVTYTILVWLQETGVTQNTEQGGVFKAGVNVTTGGNATGVTGMLDGSAVAGNYVYTINQRFYSNTGDGLLYIGQHMPNNVNVYSTGASAMSAWPTEYNSYGNDIENPFYLKHALVGDIVTESYVEFVITPAMASTSACSGMTAGTYALKGNAEYFSNNVAILQSAFGENSGYCSLYMYNGVNNFYCSANEPYYFSSWANEDGVVGVNYDNCGGGCYVECGISHFNNNGPLYSWCDIQ